jgi:adenylate kinase family enzyme/GNAT superfamily N-acetyltransferase
MGNRQMRYKEIIENAGIDFDMTFDDDTGSFATVTARAQGRTLGSVKFFMDGDTLEADMVEVDERYRGQGIAAAMYDYAKSQGYTVEKSDALTPDGEHFWNKNRGEQAVWEGVNDPHTFKCIFLFGPMGAGKSTVARPLLSHTGLRSVNLDNFNEMFIKKGQVPTGHLAPDQLEKSWQLSQTQQNNFANGRLGVIIDGSGRNPNTAIDVIEKLMPLGYEFMMIFVNVSEATSIARQQSRAAKQQQQWGVGRQVDPTLAKNTYTQVQKNLGRYSAYFGPDRFVYVDNENTPDLTQATKKVDAFLRAPVARPEALAWIQAQKGGQQVAQQQQKLATAQGRQQQALKQYNPMNPKFAKQGMAEGKITLSTDPNWYGATVDNYQASGPVVNIPANQLVGFEPDDKMNQPKSKANVEKIVAGLKKGDKLPPLLVRKYKKGYQVLDGHHRFWAYKLSGTKSIPVQIVPAKDIEEISKQGVAENTAAGINKLFNNLGDPVYANLQRVALLAMQGRQQEAHGRLNSVIKDASPQVQKKIIDAVNVIKPVTVNGRVADSSTLDKSKAHQDWILNTFIPWVQSLLGQQGVAEGENNDTAISLSKLGKFHPGADSLAEFVPERATAQYALHPDKWESTFYSLTNKDSEKLKYYGPKKISIPPGTLVGDMAIANKFYRAKTPEEKQQYAELYKASLQPYPVDVSEYRMPELLIPRQGMAEAPLADYQPIGDFDKPGPFRGADKKLIPHPVNQLKAQRFFEKTPYNFRLFFSNIPGTGKYSEYGVMDPDTVKIIFGDAGEQIVAGHENAITVVYVGNSGDSKVMLTPWMMAHRLGHAIQVGARGQMRNQQQPWKAGEDHFFGQVNSMLEEYYGKSGQPGGNLKAELTPEYNALFNAMGTQRSSRSGEIRRPYEFLYEIFAQYLGTGTVTFNALPANLGYGRRAWGNPSRYLNIKPEYRDETVRKQAAEVLSYDMELMFNDALSNVEGKILVM